MAFQPKSGPIGPISYEEFLREYDAMHAEWVDGWAVVMEPVSWGHQEIVRFLSVLLSLFVEARAAGRVLTAPFQMKTGHDLPGREPDIFFIAAAHDSQLRKNFLDGPADLAVEVVSPDSRRRDLVVKRLEYERGGVREYWVIDPIRKEAIFYQLGADARYRAAALDRRGGYHSAVLEGLWLDPEWLWQEPLPKLMDVLREWKLI